jgi:hypothetical protein
MVTHNTSDIDRDLRPLEDYAIASLLGCGLLCVAATLLGLIVWGVIAWL